MATVTNNYPLAYTGSAQVSNFYPLAYDSPNKTITNAYPLGYAGVSVVQTTYPTSYTSGSVSAAILASLPAIQAVTPSSASGGFSAGSSISPIAVGTVYKNGVAIDFTRLTLGHSIDLGWTWSVTLPYYYSAKGDLFEQPWLITIDDGLGGFLQSPPLMLLRCSGPTPDSVGGPQTTISGCDIATWRMGRAAEDFPTFRFTNSTDIVSQLAARCGVTILDHPVYPVIIDDAKQSQLSDVLGKVLGPMAYVREVNVNGQIVCRPWEQTAGSVVFDYEKFDPQVSRQDFYTSIRIGKSSTTGGGSTPTASTPAKNPDIPFQLDGEFRQKLAVPLRNCIAENVPGSVGYVDLVEYYNGDPSAGGHLIAVQLLVSSDDAYPPPLTTGAPPITHIAYNVFAPAGQIGNLSTAVNGVLRLSGTPYAQVPLAVNTSLSKSAGADPGFSYLYDARASGFISSTVPVRAASDWIDPLFPSKAVAIQRVPFILRMKNQHCYPATMDGPLQVRNPLGSVATGTDGTRYLLYSDLHTVDNTGARTTHLDFTYYSG